MSSCFLGGCGGAGGGGSEMLALRRPVTELTERFSDEAFSLELKREAERGELWPGR